ncbi:MAG: hypothetical protein HQL73_01785 [Magnetococcales bacterium]|nr:hypothetical protein [Magnetococcales bacterium]
MRTKRESLEIGNDQMIWPDLWAPERLPPLELAQVVEDCLFAYISAQSLHTRELMWPVLAEAVEALVAEMRRRCVEGGGGGGDGADLELGSVPVRQTER